MIIKTESVSLSAYWECDGEFKSVLTVSSGEDKQTVSKNCAKNAGCSKYETN